jgi:hypothetical protein
MNPTTTEECRAAYLNAAEQNLILERPSTESALGPVSFALLCHRDRHKSFEVEQS